VGFASISRIYSDCERCLWTTTPFSWTYRKQRRFARPLALSCQAERGVTLRDTRRVIGPMTFTVVTNVVAARFPRPTTFGTSRRSS
jgi:hypothetical protein